jgi:sulfur carrier protein
MNITLNGKPYNASDALTIEQLLKKRNLNKNHIVVEVNEVIVPKEDYCSHRLENGDFVEILRFVGGG